MRRRDEVLVRPYLKGDRTFPNGVHRHISLLDFESATELIVRPPAPRSSPASIERPPPLPKPRIVVVHHEPPSQSIVWLLLGATAIAVFISIAMVI